MEEGERATLEAIGMAAGAVELEGFVGDIRFNESFISFIILS